MLMIETPTSDLQIAALAVMCVLIFWQLAVFQLKSTRGQSAREYTLCLIYLLYKL